MLNSWAGELLQMAAYGVIAYAAGWCVQFRNVKVNYTRKVNFFALYLVPFVFDWLFPFDRTTAATIIQSILAAAMLAALWKPVRSRVPASK